MRRPHRPIRSPYNVPFPIVRPYCTGEDTQQGTSSVVRTVGQYSLAEPPGTVNFPAIPLSARLSTERRLEDGDNTTADIGGEFSPLGKCGRLQAPMESV